MKKFYFLLLSFLALSLCANAETLSIDFESASTAYTDWTFTNMTSQQTGSITAHGGTNYGTTGGKTTASITTKNAIAAPQSITFYVSKQSNNTTSSNWKLQVSTNSSTWEDVKTQSATSMTKGAWVEVTQDLSSYSNVYVRIYYTGSTAIRNIDDVTLTYGVVASAVEKPVITAANAADLGSDYSTLGEGTGAITFTTTTEGATIYYSTTGADATDFVAGTTFEGFKASSATDAGVKTIWAYAEKAGEKSTVASASYTFVQPQVATPVVNLDGTPEVGSNYLVGQTVKVTATCEEEGSTIVYSFTNGDDYVELPAEGVNVTSEEVATITIYVKAIKENYKDSYYVKKLVNFVNPPKEVKFTKVTDASQLIAGAKYAIIDATTTKIVSGYDKSTYTSTTTSASDGIVTAMDNAVIVFTLGGNGDAEDSWTLYDNTKGQYVGATTGTSFAYGADASELSNWTITFVGTEGNVKIYNGSRGFNFMTISGAVKNYAISNYGGDDYTYPTLWQMVEETEQGLDAVLDGNVGCKYQINCALRVNYIDDNYVYASTIGGGSTKKDAPTLDPEEVEYWSDKEADFNQNDWVAIEGLDVEVGTEIAAGSTVVLCENAAFPVVKFVSEVTPTTVGAIDANTFRVANFNINNELVKKLWLVEPQPAEHCFVKGYVASLDDVVEDAGVGVAEIKSGEKDVVKMLVNYNTADLSITATGWYLFEGVVVNGSSSLELNAVKANPGIETGVEGVEASSVKVYGAEGVINVASEEVAPIAVYSANGAIVSSVEASSASIAVAPGFYIVKAGNSVSKVTVK